jgi:hypothetical protein
VSDVTEAVSTVSTLELRAGLERALSAHFAAPRRIVRLERRPCPYRTSFALEELDAELEDGTSLQLIFKNLNLDSLANSARNVKPLFLHDPLREIEAYRTLLAPAALGTPHYYGATVDPETGRYWLFLENVPGIALWQVGELETWQEVARWLATVHERFVHETEWQRHVEHLLRYDADFYRLWLRRAQTFSDQAGTARSGSSRTALEWLASRHELVIERLVALPMTFIHGEFYPSNVLVAGSSEPLRICPIDWESAAVGPGLIDLAALTGGGWTDEERAAVALAYRDSVPALPGIPSTPADFLAAHDCCRLHLAVRWLGWSPNWLPPPEHRRDWLGEALRLAEELEL